MSSNFLAPTPSELERDWGIALDDDWSTDVVGGDYAPIIRRFGLGAAAQREAVLARFGLIPATAKTARSPGSTVNARSETAATRTAFKNAYAQRQWCIVPAQCLYVPYYAEGSKRAERWRIRRVDRSPLSIAGLWDRWVDDNGREVVSFAMLTINCDLHPLLARFDRRLNDKGEPTEKRTPVLLAEEDFDDWLDASPGRAPIYFGTFGKDDLEAEPAPSASRRTTAADAARHDDLRVSDPRARSSGACRPAVLQLGSFFRREVVLGHPLALRQLDDLLGIALQLELGQPEREAPDPFARVGRAFGHRARRRRAQRLVEQLVEQVAGRAFGHLEAVSRSHDERVQLASAARPGRAAGRQACRA